MYAVFKVHLPVTEVSLLFMEGHNLFPQAWQMLKINILNADLYRQPLLTKTTRTYHSGFLQAKSHHTKLEDSMKSSAVKFSTVDGSEIPNNQLGMYKTV